jgi:hypothetical protein
MVYLLDFLYSQYTKLRHLQSSHLLELRKLVLSSRLAKLVECRIGIRKQDGRFLEFFEAALIQDHHAVVCDNTAKTMGDGHNRARRELLSDRLADKFVGRIVHTRSRLDK